MPLQIRRGTEAERQVLAVPPVSGELIWITDDFKLYIGDGLTLAKDLPPVTGYGDANARDAAASIFTSGTHSGISFTYDGSTSIDAVVSYPALLENLSLNNFDINGSGNITINGTVTATAFRGDYKGSISADDSTILVDALNASINLSGTVKGDIIPDATEVHDIGSNTNRFKDIYLSGNSIFLGDAQIAATGSAINLPAGSTVGGELIGSSGPGNSLHVNIIGSDSSLIVDSDNSIITAEGVFANNITVPGGGSITAGSFFGNLLGNTTGFHIGDAKGSIFGDDSSILVDAVENRLFANEVITTIVDSESNPLIVKSSAANSMEVQGVIGGQVPSITINASAGVIDFPEDTEADDFIGSFKVQGYNNFNYKYASAMVTRWASDADFTKTFPKADILFSLGDNTNVQSVQASLTGTGTFYANTLQTGIYTSAPETRPTGAKGMIIFNDTTSKFQGFDGSSWVDLS